MSVSSCQHLRDKVSVLGQANGTNAIGADADIAIWNPTQPRVAGDMHGTMDDTCFAG